GPHSGVTGGYGPRDGRGVTVESRHGPVVSTGTVPARARAAIAGSDARDRPFTGVGDPGATAPGERPTCPWSAVFAVSLPRLLRSARR
ncbi:hypothetical protein, partial [Streptomyces sp. NPDC004976]